MSKQAKLVAGAIAVVILLLASGSMFVVKQHQQAVVLQFEQFVKVVQEPGLHFKLPVIQQVKTFDKRLLHFDVAPTEIVTKDKRTLLVDSFSKWRITNPEKFYKRVRTELNARGRIKEIIFSTMVQEFGQHTLEEIVSENRDVFMKDVTKRANDEVLKLQMGIKIADVRMKRADLPGENKSAVFKRMREERKRIATQFRSEGEEQANVIRAEADKDKTIMLADAYKREQELRGEGDALSIKIYADAYNQDSDFYEFTRSLDAYKKALTSDNVMVLTDKSEFLKYLGTSR